MTFSWRKIIIITLDIYIYIHIYMFFFWGGTLENDVFFLKKRNLLFRGLIFSDPILTCPVSQNLGARMGLGGADRI